MAAAWMRVTMALVFVLAWCAPFVIEAATVTESSDAESSDLVLIGYLVVYGALTLATGFVVGLPSLALPIVVYFALTPLGTHPTDSDGWTYAWLYAIPAGFLSIFVIALGWLAGAVFRRGRGERPARPADPRMWLIPVGAATVSLVAFVVLLISANSTSVEEPKLRIMNLTGDPPAPSETRLALWAGGVDTCSSPDDDLVDLEVRETQKDVVIDAGLEVHRDVPCDASSAPVGVAVDLKGRLGERRVIDDSRGLDEVIWSPETGDRLGRLTVETAERFLLSKRSGSEARCRRANAQYFDCDYRRADTGRRSDVQLRILPTGALAFGP